MYAFEFPSLKLLEHTDAGALLRDAGKWLTEREAEHHMMWALMGRQAAEHARTGVREGRYFTLMDGRAIVAVALVARGILHTTWASAEMVEVMVNGLLGAGVTFNAAYGPGHVAYFLSEAWSARVGARAVLERSDRVYQIARVACDMPGEGRLALAGEAELAVAVDWLRGYAAERGETEFEAEVEARRLVGSGMLYMWMHPGPVAMGAFLDATPHGGSIRYLYVPRALRRKGYGGAMAAGLAAEALGRGRRYCFMVADPTDNLADRLLQKVGARTICEFARWRVG